MAKKKSYEELKKEIEREEQERQKRESPWLEPREYTIAGQKYVQDYLTIPETIQITKLLKDIPFDQVESVLDFIEKLYETGVFEQFMNVILKGEQPIRAQDMRPKEAVEVLTDFFYLNEVSAIIELIISRMPGITDRLQAIGMK